MVSADSSTGCRKGRKVKVKRPLKRTLRAAPAAAGVRVGLCHERNRAWPPPDAVPERGVGAACTQVGARGRKVRCMALSHAPLLTAVAGEILVAASGEDCKVDRKPRCFDTSISTMVLQKESFLQDDNIFTWRQRLRQSHPLRSRRGEATPARFPCTRTSPIGSC